MISITTLDISSFQPALLGMRNSMDSRVKGDSSVYLIGDNDLKLAKKLANAGPSHAKYRRMIVVWYDILAPLYWWKEFDSYKVGVVTNSTSTMHTIQKKEFTIDDFSHEHLLLKEDDLLELGDFVPYGNLELTILCLNQFRRKYLETNDKTYWWQMIQLLPSSYNQLRTVMLSYENLAKIYSERWDHKLDEWVDFCKYIMRLPYAEELIITKESCELPVKQATNERN